MWLLEDIYQYIYVHGLTDESKNLYEAYKQWYTSHPFDNRTMKSGNLLLDKMTEEKRKVWEEVITSTNMTHNSRKAWKTINKLYNDLTSSNPPCLVTVNQVDTPAPRQWQRYHAIQAEATCTNPSNRRIYLKGLPFQRRRIQQRWQR